MWEKNWKTENDIFSRCLVDMKALTLSFELQLVKRRKVDSYNVFSTTFNTF
jgi:hypothetical protein